MRDAAEVSFDGVLSDLKAGISGPGVALNLELTSEAGEVRKFIVRLFAEDARQLSAILEQAASVAAMGEPATPKRQ